MRARGVVKIGKVKAQWVHGYHVRVKGRHYIYSETREGLSVWDFTEIYPDSLALDTGVPDKKGKAIYSSYPVNGVMSRGGDKTESIKGTIFTIEWDRGGLGFIGRSKTGIAQLSDLIALTEFDIKIIGTQWEGEQ